MKDFKEPNLKLYNTATRKVEVFEPIIKGEVGIYCCGPTVYNYQHIGNLRTYVFEDILVRVLRYGGYKVKHVMNITDVGHLVSDADEGEDKMLVASKREGKKSEDIADYYTKIFFEHCAWLNIQRPDIVCKATDHIPEMLGLIKKLQERGAAYVSGGNVYFDVSADKDYGKLALLDLESLKAGARIEVDAQKKHPLDFALWFTKSKFENQELQWDSPWGRGYPGWHIECSAMSMKYLGESFDIHCGGIDHIPVHHTNEIAQSETASGQPFARFWMHGGFLVVGADKMSKSSGGFLTLDTLPKEGVQPLSYRLFCMSGIYRNELSWNWEAVRAAESVLKKIKSAVLTWKEEAAEGDSQEKLSAQYSDYTEEFRAEIFNDLNMPKALAIVHQMIKDPGLTAKEKLLLIEDFDKVLGLGVSSWRSIGSDDISVEAKALLEQRQQARTAKNWKLADELREKISQLGYLIEDNKDGVRLKRK